jgi:hypothetical protein
MSLLIHIRNFVYRIFWAHRLTHLKRIEILAQSPLKAVHFTSWRSMTYAEVILNGRVYYVEILGYDANTRRFMVQHDRVTIENPTEFNDQALLELYWTWAVSGDDAFGAFLVAALNYADRDKRRVLLLNSLAEAIGRVSAALEGLSGNSPNYKALYVYLERVRRSYLVGETRELREAVNASLSVGGR